MGRESGSILMEEKKLDSGLRNKSKESLNDMTTKKDLLIERFIRMIKKSRVKKLKRRFIMKEKKETSGELEIKL